MNELNLCKCGKPAHPCYGQRCEDCWANDAAFLIVDHRGPHRAFAGHGNAEDGISNQSWQVVGTSKKIRPEGC